ncbi:MAG: hypothetical protein JO264_22155 [Acidisphaera sp.]|nr:hypothetical protein [Acidisphaera sp.]
MATEGDTLAKERRVYRMMQLGQIVMNLPGVTGAGLTRPDLKSTAHWKLWRDSTTKATRWQPTSKPTLRQIWEHAQAYDRQTHEAGKHGGAIGHSAMTVLRSLIFDFHNAATGQLDPSWAAISRRTGLSRSAVHTALARLRDLGIVSWMRRAVEKIDDYGSFILEQISNAYALLPWGQWRGYKPPPPAPEPEAGTWGDHPCGDRHALDQAVAEGKFGEGTTPAKLAALESDPADGLAAALAAWGRAIQEREAQATTESPATGQQPPQNFNRLWNRGPERPR